MSRKPSAWLKALNIDYPIYDNELPFSEYISICHKLIANTRIDLKNHAGIDPRYIVEANSPFNVMATLPSKQEGKSKKSASVGALLIHGLFDSPFTLRDIAAQLRVHHIPSRAVLLPGHGIFPGCLLDVTYHDWLQTVRYGIASLRREVEHIVLIGFSTGGLLALYHALLDEHIAALALLAPAIKIKAPVDRIVHFHYLTRWLRQHRKWVDVAEENDYVKYRSVPFNAVAQVSLLGEEVRLLSSLHTLPCPLLMLLSLDDETISAKSAIDYFTRLPGEKNKLLLYTSKPAEFADRRIVLREIDRISPTIQNLSHVSLPFSPDNKHYGQQGDYRYASHAHAKNTICGAYNRVEIKFTSHLYSLGLLKKKRLELTFNPDFDFMTNTLVDFIRQVI